MKNPKRVKPIEQKVRADVWVGRLFAHSNFDEIATLLAEKVERDKEIARLQKLGYAIDGLTQLSVADLRSIEPRKKPGRHKEPEIDGYAAKVRAARGKLSRGKFMARTGVNENAIKRAESNKRINEKNRDKLAPFLKKD